MKHLQILCSKNLFLLIFLVCINSVSNAQSYPYQEKWKEIEKKESEGLLKSTKPVVDEIYIQSKKDRWPQQKIKALLYQSKIEIITEEGKQQEAKLHKRFKDEIQAAAGVERSILQSLLAELLNEYFQQHRYQISGRTNEDSTSKNDDFLTWSETAYKKEVTTLYDTSIDDIKQLQQEPIGKWDIILDTATQYRELRPTLFDLLAHRAISYYVANNEQKRAEEIIAILLKQHANDASKNTYLYNSLLGIELKRKASDDDWLVQLKALSRLNPEAWYTAEILLQLANAYQQKLSSEPKERYAERKRYADSILYICEQANELYLHAKGNKQLQLIKKNILAPEISMQTERVNIPKQSIPVYLAHKNVNKIYVKILKYKKSISGYLANEFNAWRDIKKQQDVDSLLKLYPEIESYTITPKKFDDYDQHTTIAKFNALDDGAYIALVSNNGSFKLDSVNMILFQPINVSINSLVFKEEELLLTDRDSGQPISKSEVTIYEPSGNGKDLRLLEKLITDENGRASYNENTSLNKGSKRWVYQVKGDETFFDTQQYFYNASNEQQEDKQLRKVQFFTDRGIYRPGQTLYFKGIIYKETTGKRQTLVGYKAKIHLYDSNNEKVATTELTSNQFGSVFGNFTLPMGKATGSYHLEEEEGDGEIAFRVEEYKRPTFSVVMDTVKTQYKIGDSIVAKGIAQAYSGAVIGAGKVNYRVVRNSVYPYRSWLTSRPYFPARSEEIAVGETNTDANGRFEIPFQAKAADVKEADHYRYYNYTLELSVTDINGETRQGGQTIMVGDKSVMLQVSLPQNVNIDQLDSIPFRTLNLNGQPVSAKGNIRLIKLKAPGRILRQIPFSETDYMLMDSLSYIRNFPHIPFGNEHNVENWTKGNLVMDKDFNSAHQHMVMLEKTQEPEAGTYLLEAYVLDGNDTLRTTQIVHAHRIHTKEPVDKEFLRVTALKSQYKPGENAIVMFSSVLPHATIFVELEQNGKIIRSENLTLNNEVKQFEFPIPEQQGDKLFLHYHMGKYNAVESGRLEIAIQQKATDLTITTSTFRDKLQPGKEEMWELNISGPNKDKLFAEVLATMYDASLDQFAQHNLYFRPAFKDTYSKIPTWNTNYAYGINYGSQLFLAEKYNYLPTIKYEDLEHFGFSFANERWKQRRYLSKQSSRSDQVKTEESGVMDFNAVAAAPTRNSLQEVVVLGYGNSEMKQDITGSAAGIQLRGSSSLPAGSQALYVVDGEIIQGTAAAIKPEEIMSIQVLKGEEAIALYGSQGANGVIIVTTKKATETALEGIKVRTNLKETAFFYPDLKTDAEGNIKIHFTSPESLTQWKFMALAHTNTLETGYLEQRVRTSKDLMVVPNAPRFLREGDELVLSTKIINLSDSNLNGAAKLMLFDAYTMQPVDSLYALTESTRPFETKKGASTSLSWHLKIPASHLLGYRIAATAGNFTDGEEAVLPILPNKMLVTETLPLYAKEGQTKHFTMQALAEASKETTHARLTLELTSNPMWYAIQALPYLQEYPYDCSEQLFAKLYSTLVSKQLMDASPKIKVIFDDWNKKGLLKSKLETNQELKSILLEETPWIREAENEETKMKRLALLFDVNNLRNQWQSTYQKFAARQLSSGGFSWFEGGEASVAITTHIVAGFGHLKNMKADIADLGDSSYQQVLHKAIQYLDEETIKDFNYKENWSVYTVARYLYARSYFLKEYPLKEDIKKRILTSLDKDLNKGFTDNLQEKAMLSLVYYRYGQLQKSRKIISSLKDYAVNNDEMGMYWKENKSGWNWWQSPIETQTFLIEAFQEVAQDTESVEQMKLWLLKNKQTNHWNSTKATTEAIYALLFTGKDWLAAEDGLEVKLGNQRIDLKGPTTEVGYIKASWEPLAIKSDMAKVEIVKTSPGPVWGGLYWQHFEKLTSIKEVATGVQLERTLYLKENTDRGPVLKPITSSTPLKVGDLVTVKLIIRADRDLEFVHLKDMRASGFEPVNVLSSFKWQNGLGYYESTRDAATNFFIDRVPKGTYVFEYDVRANNAGKFSNGISSIQSMYAPEMSAHSEGVPVNIGEIQN